MPKFIVTSVYDRVADAFGPLQMYASDAIAIRDVKTVVLDRGTQFHAHAADYSLWHIADFDDANGSIVAVERRLVVNFDAAKPMEG